MSPKDDDLTADLAQKTARPTRMLIVRGEIAGTHPLPERGQLIVGRSSRGDVPIDDASISRRHAVIHLGPRVEVEDLGSSNGTWVGGVRLLPATRVAVRVGDSLRFGDVVAVLQAEGGVHALRGLPAATFEASIDAEIERAARMGTAFAVIRLDVTTASATRAADAISSALSPLEVLGDLAPGRFAVLARGAAEKRAARVRGRVTDELARRGVEARFGVAVGPIPGAAAEHLAAAQAKMGAPGAPSSSSHTPEGASDGAVIVSDDMRRVSAMVARIATGTINVLVLGETGVGKEVVARLIHARSARASEPFVVVNCPAFAENLLESELFGHQRGAFTGAESSKRGLLARADRGTVFLDEVGDLPLGLQAKILRVLEDRQVTPVGAEHAQSIDVRFVAATNRDLAVEVAASRFRADLYFRLAGASIVVPPLRERPSDVEPLARYWLRAAARQLDVAEPEIEEGALAALGAHDWPGNVRELRNVIERALLVFDGGAIRIDHLELPRRSVPSALPSTEAPLRLEPSGSREGESLRGELQTVERDRIVEALAACVGNQTRAAEMLGVSRRTLVAKLARYGIPRPRKP